jgi:PhnB protein
MELNPYLLFNGDCEEALKFYEQTFGGKIEALMRFEGSPAAQHAPAGWGNKVLHATLNLDGNVVMASDAPQDYHRPQGISVAIGLDDKDRAERIFNALAQGGTTTMPFQKTFFASGFGMCVDRFGIPWMVNCDQKENE